MIYDGETGAVFGPLVLEKNSPGAMHGMQASGVVEVLKLVKLNRLQEGMYTKKIQIKTIYIYIYIIYEYIWYIYMYTWLYFHRTFFFFQKRIQFFFDLQLKNPYKHEWTCAVNLGHDTQKKKMWGTPCHGEWSYVEFTPFHTLDVFPKKAHLACRLSCWSNMFFWYLYNWRTWKHRIFQARCTDQHWYL